MIGNRSEQLYSNCERADLCLQVERAGGQARFSVFIFGL